MNAPVPVRDAECVLGRVRSPQILADVERARAAVYDVAELRSGRQTVEVLNSPAVEQLPFDTAGRSDRSETAARSE
ncbi:hypothetical protein ACH47B_01820 [Rhodococcus sp. NPDC019627]|uniref:hypothetical protein n=1 Tax=unclassified Rhodococcus (in: high G+C Gram-positive bacteria) TaxID=192944 RepID=UPI0033DD4DD8